MKKILCSLFVLFNFFSTFAGTSENNFSFHRSFLNGNQYYRMDGEWEYADNTFIPPETFYPEKPDFQMIKKYNVKSVSMPYPIENHYGFATYHCRLEGLNPQEEYHMFLHDWLYTAADIYVNGEKIVSYGKPGRTEAESKPTRGMIEAVFEADMDGVCDFVIHVSNFEYRKGGIVQQPWFAAKTNHLLGFITNMGFELFLAAALFMVMIYNFVIFFINRKRMEHLALALLSFIFIGIALHIDFSMILYFFPNIPLGINTRFSVLLISLATPMYLTYLFYLYGLSRKKTKFILWFYSIIIAAELFLPIKILSYVLVGCIVSSYVVFCIIIYDLIKSSHKPYALYIGNIVILILILLTSMYGLIIVEFIDFTINKLLWFKMGLLAFAILQARFNGLKRDYMVDEIDGYAQHFLKLNDSFYRFVPESIFNFLQVSKMEDVKPGVCIVNEIMLLSVDIRNFTVLSEGLDSKQTFTLISEYCKLVSPIVRKYDGFIVKYLGDGIIAMFPNKTNQVCSCAVEIQEKLKAAIPQFKESGIPEFKVGCAIHYGTVAVGMMGNNTRMDSVACSDAIRQVVKLESLNKTLGTEILISEEAITYCRSDAKFLFEGHLVQNPNEEMLVYSVKKNKLT